MRVFVYVCVRACDVFDASHACFQNLVTPITSLAFSRDGSLLALASNRKPDVRNRSECVCVCVCGARLTNEPRAKAMRLFDVARRVVHKEFPKQTLGHVSCVAFAPRDGRFIVGNARGNAMLFRKNG